MNQRKNIIFIQCDSMDGRIMGCMGHPAMKHGTPNLDKLAGSGVLFSNSYTNNPICCPSRASMWSGQYTHNCEGWNNYKGLEKGARTFQTELDENGYHTMTFGKTDYLSGYHTIRARVSPWTRSANIMKPNYRMEAPVILPGDEKRVHKHDWDNVERSIGWLRETAACPEKPFMLYLGLNAPHPQFITSEYYLSRIDEEGIVVPPDDESDHPVMEYQRINKNWEHGFSEEMIRKVRRIYCAMIAEVDAMVGTVLEAVEELGLKNSTYIIFTSDHGEMAMEHKQFYKMNLYEPAARIPMIISGPGLQKGVEAGRLVSLIDIYPTLMDIAGIEKNGELDGYSLIPELTGEKGTRPDWVFAEFHDTSCNTGVFMVRQGEWKYIAYPGYDPMLFNLREDPWEVKNMASIDRKTADRMDRLLRSIVDYEAVDDKVKAYDRRSFAEWRAKQQKEGTYWRDMSRVFSGWDDLESDDRMIPWTEKDEKLIKQWLGEK